MIEKIISGGQIGADIAALRAAKKCGIETGGWLPKFCTTKDGLRPEYLTDFSMLEHSSSGYKPRTFANVRDSDATMRFAHYFGSAGERCTLKAIEKYKKPVLDVFLVKYDRMWTSTITASEAANWLDKYSIKVLNVAGNADRSIEFFVEDFIMRVLNGSR